MNYVFVSYAGENKKIAVKLANEINTKLKGYFLSELVEDRKEGDTTFTDKVINYFKKCNVFIVIITRESLKNQFVNQEWGYAKCLKELGQIQILLHIKGRRIKPKGFISTNMDFFNLEYNKAGKPEVASMTSKVIDFLNGKKDDLIPIFTEKQQKLKRTLNEINHNIELLDDFINSENEFRSSLSINHLKFGHEYAYQLLQVGYLFKMDLLVKIEEYIKSLEDLNIQKDFMILWAISQARYHQGNIDKFYKTLRDYKPILLEVLQLIEEEYRVFEC